MVVLFIKAEVLPENRMELQQTLRSLRDSIRQEKGCLSFAIFLNLMDESNFVIEEEWEGREELYHHLRSENFAVLFGAVTCLSTAEKLCLRTMSPTKDSNDIQNLRKRMVQSGTQL
jgi:quinol monooxygenase YgiN